MDEIMLLVGLIGALFLSLGIGIDGIQKEKLVKRVGGALSLAGAGCFLVVLIAKVLGKF
ncbi:MAG: hypothetical protein PHI24_06045 [Desulfitobacteriaceae bacterium]|nr:hypothetical protein [Desulfitobacteriaceae bacterium]